MLGTAMHVTGLGDGAVLYGRYLPISITCNIYIYIYICNIGK